MELTLHIPDDVAQRLSASGGDLSRRALEAFSLEEFKAGRLTEAQLRQLLRRETRDALDGFLKAHEVWLNYTPEDLERERAALPVWDEEVDRRIAEIDSGVVKPVALE